MTGEHEGRCIFKKSMCTTPQNMKFLFEDISNCGSTPPEHAIEALDLGDISERAIEVRKYTKEGDSGSFVNVYINKYLGHRDEVRTRIRVDGDIAPTPKRFNDENLPFKMYVECQHCGQVFTRRWHKKHLVRCAGASEFHRFIFRRTTKWPRKGHPVAKHLIEAWEEKNGR